MESGMEPKETPIQSAFMGFVKRAECPGCGALLAKNLVSSIVLCSQCGDYAAFGEKTLKPVEPAAVELRPFFAAPTSWPDIQAPTFSTLMHPAVTLAEMIRTKKEDARLLEARWPEGCCVCGKPAARVETISQRVGFSPPEGLLSRAQKETTVVAKDIPHCGEHKDGARFERVVSFGDTDVMALGIFFRSYAYQIQFRRLNPWKWLKA
jgi:hypothetical protein